MKWLNQKSTQYLLELVLPVDGPYDLRVRELVEDHPDRARVGVVEGEHARGRVGEGRVAGQPLVELRVGPGVELLLDPLRGAALQDGVDLARAGAVPRPAQQVLDDTGSEGFRRWHRVTSWLP